MDPDWVDVFLIENGDIPANELLVYQRVTFAQRNSLVGKHSCNLCPGIWFPPKLLKSMVGMLVPLKGGIGGIVHPPIGRKNTTYIPLIVLAEPGGWKMLPIPPFRGTRNNHWWDESDGAKWAKLQLQSTSWVEGSCLNGLDFRPKEVDPTSHNSLVFWFKRHFNYGTKKCGVDALKGSSFCSKKRNRCFFRMNLEIRYKWIRSWVKNLLFNLKWVEITNLHKHTGAEFKSVKTCLHFSCEKETLPCPERYFFSKGSKNPDAQCMVYLPTFTPKTTQM